MTNSYEIVRAWGMNARGMDVPVGWDLMVNDNWGNRYHLKRDAKAALAEALKEDAEAERAERIANKRLPNPVESV